MNTFLVMKYIKRLKKSNIKYTLKEAHKLICKQIKQEEALREEEMEWISDDVWARLSENWPFKDVIK